MSTTRSKTRRVCQQHGLIMVPMSRSTARRTPMAISPSSGTNSTAIINGTRNRQRHRRGQRDELEVVRQWREIGAGAVSTNATGTLAGTGSIDGNVSNSGIIAPATRHSRRARSH